MKAIYIIAEEGFRDEEYFEPKEILEQNSIEVITGSTKKVAKSKLGLEVETCTLLEDIKSEEYELIILAGGPGTHNYFENLTLRKLLKEFDEQNKLIAAICIAPIILAKAGMLREEKDQEEILYAIREFGFGEQEKDVKKLLVL